MTIKISPFLLTRRGLGFGTRLFVLIFAEGFRLWDDFSVVPFAKGFRVWDDFSSSFPKRGLAR